MREGVRYKDGTQADIDRNENSTQWHDQAPEKLPA